MNVETYFTTFFILVGLPMAVAIAAFVLAAVVYTLAVTTTYFLTTVKDTESDSNG